MTNRVGNGKFTIDDINTNLCTHGFYAFADMDPDTFLVKPYDPWYDLAEGDSTQGYNCTVGGCFHNGYRKFVALGEANPNFVPMLSIGGWNSGSEKYSIMAGNPVYRRTFIDSVVVYLKKFGFAGLDFDWEYPGVREGANSTVDKEDYDLLVHELHDALKPQNLLLSAALGAGWDKMLVAYDMPYLNQYFDFYNIMAYDYHGAWEK